MVDILFYYFGGGNVSCWSFCLLFGFWVFVWYVVVIVLGVLMCVIGVLFLGCFRGLLLLLWVWFSMIVFCLFV